MSDCLEEFYLALCSRCLCNDERGVESGLFKTVIQIRHTISNNTDEKARLLSLSILRLACELLKTCKPCVLIYKFCERAASILCPLLLDYVDCVDPFVSYLSRKTLTLFIEQFPDICSFCVAELCNGVSTGTSPRLLALVDILRIENEVSDLSLGGQESISRCSTEVKPDLLSRRNVLKTQKAIWTLEIEKHSSVWFLKFNFTFMLILNLWCQLAITSLDMQMEEVIFSLTKFEVIHIMQNLISSQKSKTTFIHTLKSLLASSSLNSKLRKRISTQFLVCIKENSQLYSVCKRNDLKQGFDVKKERYDCVMVRNMISCSLFSLLNVDDVELKEIFQNLFVLLEKCNCELGQNSYEELIISSFLDQDDEIVNTILCHVDLYLKYKIDSQEFFSPFKLFQEFFKTINFDHSVLLDMLMSNETRMLLLLVRFLKLTISEWSSFVKVHSVVAQECKSNALQNDELDASDAFQNDELDKTMSVFVKLGLSIERFEDKGIFPYNATPLLRLLNQVEACYESL